MKKNKPPQESIDQSKDPRWPNLQSALKLARKKGFLEFTLAHDEYEEGHTDEANNISYPAREGYSSEDISGYCVPDSLKEYLKANIQSFKENYKEFGVKDALIFTPWELPWKPWIWTLNSTKYVSNDIVDEKYRPKKKKADKYYYYANYDRLVSEVTSEEIFFHLDANYKKLSENIWVNPSDYSDFQYNHLAKPYSCKDGWSLKQVEEIMQEWLKAVMNEDIPVRHRC